MKAIKDYENETKVRNRTDLLAFLTVQVALIGLFLGLYFVAGFEITVISMLAVIMVQVAQP